MTLEELSEDIPYIVTRDCGILQKGFHVTNYSGMLTCIELPSWTLRYYKDPIKFRKLYQRARFEIDYDRINSFIKFHQLKVNFYENFKRKD